MYEWVRTQKFVSLQEFGASYFLAKTAKKIVLLLKQRNTTVHMMMVKGSRSLDAIGRCMDQSLCRCVKDQFVVEQVPSGLADPFQLLMATSWQRWK